MQSVFVATPVHSASVHIDWVAGALSCHAEFPSRYRIETQRGSFIPRQRDILTRKFFDSGCSHMMCVDSDIGWTAGQVSQLLAADRDVVSGVYCQKTKNRGLPFKFNGTAERGLLGCEWAPGGFLLISRPCIERMMGAYAALQYQDGEGARTWALWAPLFDPQTPYSSEDVAFCRRWTRLGGTIWADPRVTLRHHGDAVYIPDPLDDHGR